MLKFMKARHCGRRTLALLMSVALAILLMPVLPAQATADTYEVGDYKGEKTQAEWTYPTQEGKVFAGWYADAEFTEVYRETTGTAYAKFVADSVLNLKKQLSAGADYTSEKVSIRFLTGIDTLHYSNVTFHVRIPGEGKAWEWTEKTAYSSVLVDGEPYPYTAESVFGTGAAYFVLHSLTGIPRSVFDQQIVASVSWQTLDGTTVTTGEQSFTIMEEVGHTHSFENGICICGTSNGFENYNVWTESSLTPATREDTKDSMIMTSENAAGDWWKVKLETPWDLTEGKVYEASFSFTSNASGTIKYIADGAAYNSSEVYDVQLGENTFTVCFTAGVSDYSCLELGGLGQFQLVFTDISLLEHAHRFVNGVCLCGRSNGFDGCNVWTDGSLMPVVREDTENSITLISENAADEWWKVKLELPRTFTEGKEYEVSFSFTSNTSGTIKYSANEATFHNSNEYSVQAGENTFIVHLTAGADSYSCLELGGLGQFQLTFTQISVDEVVSEP